MGASGMSFRRPRVADGAKRKGWDLTSLHSLDAGAEWLRNRAGALLVLVVRADDVAVAVDPAIAPRDAAAMVEAAMPEIHARLESDRQAAKAEAGKQKRAAVYENNLRASGVRA